jgi:hypothetical protein
VRPEGLEPPTPGLGNRCSILLSYGRALGKYYSTVGSRQSTVDSRRRRLETIKQFPGSGRDMLREGWSATKNDDAVTGQEPVSLAGSATAVIGQGGLMRYVLAFAVMSFTACGGSPSSSIQSPVAPSPATTAAAAVSSQSTNWTVTQRFVSVTGPDNCWVREQRASLTGVVFPGLDMAVTRAGTAITLQGSFFQVNYTGTFAGRDFSAAGNGPLEVSGGRPCQDGTLFVQRPGVSNLSGRFASDDQTVTATEVNTYLLTSGEAVSYTWDWQATRRN